MVRQEGYHSQSHFWAESATILAVEAMVSSSSRTLQSSILEGTQRNVMKRKILPSGLALLEAKRILCIIFQDGKLDSVFLFFSFSVAAHTLTLCTRLLFYISKGQCGPKIIGPISIPTLKIVFSGFSCQAVQCSSLFIVAFGLALLAQSSDLSKGT